MHVARRGQIIEKEKKKKKTHPPRPHNITDGPAREETDPKNKTGSPGADPCVGDKGGPSITRTEQLTEPWEEARGGPSSHTHRPRGPAQVPDSNPGWGAGKGSVHQQQMALEAVSGTSWLQTDPSRWVNRRGKQRRPELAEAGGPRQAMLHLCGLQGLLSRKSLPQHLWGAGGVTWAALPSDTAVSHSQQPDAFLTLQPSRRTGKHW